MKRMKVSVIFLAVLLLGTLVLQLSFYPPTHAQGTGTVLFSDGFESGDFSAWSGTWVPQPWDIVEVVSSPVHQGSYAAFLSDGGIYGFSTPYLWKNFSQVDTAYARFYVRFASSGWNNGEYALFCVFGEAAYIHYTTQVGVYNNNGTYVWRLQMEDDGANPFSVISTQTVSMNKWYCVEVEKVSDASVGECRLYIDGTELLSITGKNTAYTGKIDMLFMDGELIGYPSSPTNTYFDDFVVSDSYIGPELTYVPLSTWQEDPGYSNAPYVLTSAPSSLSLQLNSADTSSRVTIYTLNVPTSDLGNFDHVDVSITGTTNARILLRFFLNDGTGFDVVYWTDPATLDTVNFNLKPYAGKTLTIAYIALMSTDGSPANIDITQIALVATPLPPKVPLSGWIVDSSLTNAQYTLSSSASSLSLQLNPADTTNRVTIYTLNVPTSDLGNFDHVDVSITGTTNARILMRFFLDDGSGFDVVYWADPTTLNAINFDLSAYAGRKLTIAYIALMSSDSTPASIDITQIALVATAPPPVVPLSDWKVDPSLTNAAYTLSSTETNLSLQLTAVNTNSRVTIYTLGVPTLNLGDYNHIDVAVTGTANARILMRFFLDDGSGFDVVYWADPATLDAISFDLSAYSGRTLTIAYIALMSSNGLTASVDITDIAFVATPPPPVVPLSDWKVDPSLTNAAYTLSSTETNLSLQLTAVNTNSRVTIYTLGVPTLNLGNYNHIDVSVTGTSNARILMRFFLDDGSGFDVVYWADPATLDAISFDLSPYAGRTLTIAYIALMSSDGSMASIDITQIALVA